MYLCVRLPPTLMKGVCFRAADAGLDIALLLFSSSGLSLSAPLQDKYQY